MSSFHERCLEKEILDTQTFDDPTTSQIYRRIQSVNRWLGGTRVILSHFKRFSKQWTPGQTISVLDVGSGAADIPEAIVLWGRKHGFNISVTALDFSLSASRLARARLSDFPEIRWIAASNPDLPFHPGSFDYVISSLFFHHMTDEDIKASLIKFDETARRGIIINDLLRFRLAYAGFWMFSKITGPQNTADRVFHEDGLLSVKKSFRRNEVEAWAKTAGLSYLNHFSHFIYRFALAGEKNV